MPAGLVVNELVTNSVAAGASYIELEVQVGEQRIDLTVIDDARGLPTPRESTSEDVNGRGLAIVERLAHQWSVTSSALDVTGSVPGVDEAAFARFAVMAKDDCPVSRALLGNVSITVEASLSPEEQAAAAGP